jgi:hypothetical protein
MSSATFLRMAVTAFACGLLAPDQASAALAGILLGGVVWSLQP